MQNRKRGNLLEWLKLLLKGNVVRLKAKFRDLKKLFLLFCWVSTISVSTMVFQNSFNYSDFIHRSYWQEILIIHMVISSRKPLYMEKQRIHGTVNLSAVNQAGAACTAWGCAFSVTFRLCSAVQIPWLQDNVTKFTATEEPSVSSHSVPVITLPMRPCLYLKVQQEVLIRT